MIDFGREVCGQLPAAERREWLITNGIGGYGMGTVAGALTRRYHGLLIAALKPPVGRVLLLTRLDETASYAGHAYALFVNRWATGEVAPAGYRHIERFRLEGTTPVWTFALADALLEKRVWMQPGANTTHIRYDLQRATLPLTLDIKALVNFRDHHGNTHAADWPVRVMPAPHGLRIVVHPEAVPLYLLSARAEAAPAAEWYRGYFLSVEAYRGLEPLDDHLYAGHFRVSLRPGESVTLVASTESAPELDGHATYAARVAYERGLLAQAGVADAEVGAVGGWSAGPAPFDPSATLVLAADQFIVRRGLSADPDGCSVIAGYPWFGDWGRDTMISLPGLTLATGRRDVAAAILRTFAHFVDRGMLPNRFPDAGEQPEYNTVDATLWYFEAIRAYVAPVPSAVAATSAATGDDSLLRELYPVLQEIVAWHRRGTRFNIHVDPADGLLYAGQPGVQLTWMDAKVGDWVVTPRIGKPVEINALWYNALRCMADFARRLGEPAEEYATLAARARAGFGRFWNAAAGYCYDVIDGPDGTDPALRPNQLLAVSLPHSPLDPEQQRSVVDACARHLLTSHGLRSLSPADQAYSGHYGGDQRQRDAAYHQGTVWGWLIGPFVAAHLRVYGDRATARSFLAPLVHHLADHGLGSISEIFEGDPPFMPRGCIAQAWSVAELLRAWQLTGEGMGP